MALQSGWYLEHRSRSRSREHPKGKGKDKDGQGKGKDVLTTLGTTEGNDNDGQGKGKDKTMPTIHDNEGHEAPATLPLAELQSTEAWRDLSGASAIRQGQGHDPTVIDAEREEMSAETDSLQQFQFVGALNFFL